MSLIKKRISRWPGYSIDDGVASKGIRYGGDNTIHNTGTIDIVMNEDGLVTEVWFRCHMLPFKVSQPKGLTVYQNTDDSSPIVAIEFEK